MTFYIYQQPLRKMQNVLSAYCQEQSERRATLVERIRHWTREGLIQPIGKKNPGTGRHREYDANVLFDVAVLNLVANLGLQVGQQKIILKEFRDLYDERNDRAWKELDLYITMSSVEGEPPHVDFHLAEGSFPSEKYSQSDAFIAFNVRRIFRRFIERRDALQGGEKTARKAALQNKVA